jgi:hypothetical protein
MTKHEITRADIMPMEAYATVRRERRRAITELKKNRRMAVGPDATFYFECYDTMWHQVHEMLHIERGGEAQIPDELLAYNPLIPKGDEVVATLMFEIDDPVRRAQVLDRLGGVEESVTLNFEGEVVTGVAEEDIDRTTADGKASSVQFLHFPFTASQIETFRRPGTRVIVAISHPGYDHQAGMPEEVRAALAQDFD